MKLLFVTIPQLARALTESFVGAFRLMITLWFFAITRKLFGEIKDFKIVAISNGKPVLFYLRYVMDIAVLREIYLDKEYDWCPIEDPKVIIDLGAHFGDTTLYYATRFPNAKIIAVEPSPENYDRLVQHTKTITNITPVQAAVGATDGEITLHLLASSLGHSVTDRKGISSSIVVPQVSLKTLFKNHGIEKADLIKFDIEGAEFDMLSNIDPRNFASAYTGELHFDLVKEFDLDRFKELFSGFNVVAEQLQNKHRYIIKASKND